MLPKPPPEPKRITALDLLAPKFRTAVMAILAEMQREGYKAKVFESVRTNERQEWLYGMGRDYDDGRGPVTKSPTATRSWHYYGAAVDIVEDDDSPWMASQAFWQTLGLAAERNGCTWGGRWKMADLPHVQWGRCRVSPSAKSLALYRDGGMQAVWEAIGAA